MTNREIITLITWANKLCSCEINIKEQYLPKLFPETQNIRMSSKWN